MENPISIENSPDSPEMTAFLCEHWGAPQIVSRGKITDAGKLPRAVSRDDRGKLIGLATYNIDSANRSCEIVSIDAVIRGQGIGSRLLAAVENEARKSGCRKIWLITTNDNLEAATFYIKRGYRLAAVHLDALDLSRKLKPSIPKTGNHHLPLQDEWEFEKKLENNKDTNPD